MIIFYILILGIALQIISPFVPNLQQKSKTVNVFLAICLFLSCISAPLLLTDSQFYYELLNFKSINLTINLQYDNLVYILFGYVSLVNLIVTKYSATYLSFERSNQFIYGKFWILTGSVLLFACSADLVTTFIAWQLIGISLYNLLNHYSKNQTANQTANLQILTSRVGDALFLAALVLAMYYFGTTQYQDLIRLSELSLTTEQIIVERTIIGLVILSALIKCGQIPFHTWLISSMEAPTPVSVIMHAGVITAGGILFVKISPWLINHPDMLCMIAVWGLITALLGKSFMLFQGDIKRQLAYSTIGQIGFMFVQCGFGCFVSALFHIITHGLFKSYLFMRVGSNLPMSNYPKEKIGEVKQTNHVASALMLVIAFGFSFICYCLYYMITGLILNPLFGLFGSFTLWSLINFTQRLYIHQRQKLILHMILGMSYLSYILVLSFMSEAVDHITSENEYSLLFNRSHFMLVSVMLIAAFIYASMKSQARFKLKEYIPSLILARKEVIEDYRIRLCTNYNRLKSKLSSLEGWGYILVSFLIGSYLVLSIYNTNVISDYASIFARNDNLLLTGILVVPILYLLSAFFNEKLSNIKASIISIILFITINLCHGLSLADEINRYILLNTSLLLSALFLIFKCSKYFPNKNIVKLYTTSILLLLVGIPGSAVFVYHMFTVNHIMSNSILVFIIMLAIWLWAGKNSLKLMPDKVDGIKEDVMHTKKTHINFALHSFCLSAIGVNCVSGLNPSFLINFMQ
tara:strand:+ start:10440 stop:12686 length:2247 start_codon:yes stop_codon:yes gene_type:complete